MKIVRQHHTHTRARDSRLETDSRREPRVRHAVHTDCPPRPPVREFFYLLTTMYRFRGIGGLVGGVIVGGGVAKLRSEHEALCESAETNTAFVFVKPHANTTATQGLVKSTLQVRRPCCVSAGGGVGWLIESVTSSPCRPRASRSRPRAS